MCEVGAPARKRGVVGHGQRHVTWTMSAVRRDRTAALRCRIRIEDEQEVVPGAEEHVSAFSAADSFEAERGEESVRGIQIARVESRLMQALEWRMMDG
jgi:hypothetical protein